MELIIEQYKTWLLANSRSYNTIRGYLTDVRDFISENNIQNVSDINEELINKYFANLTVDKMQQASINHMLSSLRSFLKFNHIDIRIPKNKRPMKRRVKAFTEAEFEVNILPVIDILYVDSLRIKALLSFIYYTGLRISEACTISRDQIDLDNNIMIVKIPKQNLERKVVISQKLKPLLVKYFISESQKTTAFNLCTQRVREIFDEIEKHIQKTDSNFILHPHKFRKSWATNATKLGMNITDVQHMMQHKSILTTLQYVEEAQTDELNDKFLRLEAEQIERQKEELKNKRKK